MLAALMMAVASASVGQTASLTHLDSYSTGMLLPGRVAATAGGGVYVTDQQNGAVLEYDNLGALLGTYALSANPVGVAVHPDGRVFVARLDGMVGVYDAAFVELAVLDATPFVLGAPNDLAYNDLAGELYVVNSGAHNVLVFAETIVGTNDWAVVRAWGTEGNALSEFLTPQAIAIDTNLDHVIITDADNFRVQVFDTAGVFLFKFGYRTLFFNNTETAWFPRAGGVAVDSCSNIFVSDALMGTVRVFGPTGQELDANHLPILDFGTGAGDLRVPMDLAIGGGQFYAASGDNAAVEVYGVSCTFSGAGGTASLAKETNDRTPRTKIRNKRTVQTPDNPLDIVNAIEDGTYARRLDLTKDRIVDVSDLEVALENFGGATVENFIEGGVAAVQTNVYEAPHIIDSNVQCGRCHDMDGMPGGGMLTAAGQENLCRSCHSGSGVAMGKVIPSSDTGLTHPVGVAADSGGVNGPMPGSLLDLHLDNGNIRCATCHDPHNDQSGQPFLRAEAMDGTLCGQCHEETAQWRNAGHADPHAEAFVHYDWSLPNRASCRQCHSGNGYIGSTQGLSGSQLNGDFRVVDCLVCHGTHGVAQSDILLRTYDTVTLPTVGPDETLTGQGAMATCMACHNGRRAPDDGSLTPHYMLGGVMLEGINGEEFGHVIMSSQHTVLGATCMDCHMADGPAAGQPGHNKVGGHTFHVSVKDPTDPDFGYENLTGCNAANCHGNTGPLTQVNRMAYGDYDGDGVVEGVQDEVQALMDLVFAEIHNAGAVFLGHYPYWDLSGVAPADDATVRGAIWNYEYVDNSGDLGIKNTAYAVGLLQASYFELTGADVPGATLRYMSAAVSATNVAIQSVNGGAPVEAGGAFTVDFTIEDDNGDPIDIADLNRLRIYASGPTSNYQIVIPSDGNLANFVQNPDGSYTYTAPTGFPTAYSPPLNDSPDFGPADGELTGLPLLEGTYTVLIESRRVFGSLRKAGDATLDFVVANDPLLPPPLTSREYVQRDMCNNCHLDLQIHGSNRFSTTGCVVCHTNGAEDRITSPASTPGVTIQFGDMIHKLHRGKDLKNVDATENGADPFRMIYRGFGGNPADFSDVGFPILEWGVTDCDACHAGAADAASIFAAPTRNGCGGCHDDLSFTSGTILNQDDPNVDGGLLTVADLSDPTYRAFPGHVAGVGGQDHTAADDNFCAGCHAPGMALDAQLIHRHSTDPAAEGTLLEAEIVSVTGMTGGGGTYFQAGDIPQITFKLKDTTADPLEIPAVADSTVVDRLYFMIVGPTTLYQQIIPDERAINGGAITAGPANWTDNFLIDGTYTYTMLNGFPADYPPQENTIGQPPADQLFPFADGWGQQYTAGGTPLDNGSYTVMVWGRRVTPSGDREPMITDFMDVPFGAADPIVPWPMTVTTDKCNSCHGVLAFHGNQREDVQLCAGCHTAGGQDGGTVNSIDLRQMVHKLHNARHLTNLPYELDGFSGIHDFSALLISSMPGEAAECQVCHVNDDWKNPPLRANMRTWMTACTSCHDSAGTAAHVDQMTVPGTFTELCASCHGDGGAFPVEAVHASH